MSYDPECEKLAEYFLTEVILVDHDNRSHLVRNLAQHIEDAIAEWARGLQRDAEDAA